MFTILKEGQRVTYAVTAALLASLLGDSFKKGTEFQFSTGSDNGNSVGIEHDAVNRFTVIGREPGYAAVTVTIADDKGQIVGVLGAQYFVTGVDQPTPVGGDLDLALETTEEAKPAADAGKTSAPASSTAGTAKEAVKKT